MLMFRHQSIWLHENISHVIKWMVFWGVIMWAILVYKSSHNMKEAMSYDKYLSDICYHGHKIVYTPRSSQRILVSHNVSHINGFDKSWQERRCDFRIQTYIKKGLCILLRNMHEAIKQDVIIVNLIEMIALNRAEMKWFM